jgi:heptosyltransferase II
LLEAKGFKVNLLPTRPTIRQHIADVQNHKFLVSGDSLPMHIALGSEIKCLTLFQCTSPWEIHDYGVQTKIVSPLLEKYFYKRHFDIQATTCITLDEVYNTIIQTFHK